MRYRVLCSETGRTVEICADFALFAAQRYAGKFRTDLERLGTLHLNVTTDGAPPRKFVVTLDHTPRGVGGIVHVESDD